MFVIEYFQALFDAKDLSTMFWLWFVLVGWGLELLTFTVCSISGPAKTPKYIAVSIWGLIYVPICVVTFIMGVDNDEFVGFLACIFTFYGLCDYVYRAVQWTRP